MRIVEKPIKEGLYYKNWWVAAVNYLPDNRKHRYKLVDKPKKQHKRTFIQK